MLCLFMHKPRPEKMEELDAIVQPEPIQAPEAEVNNEADKTNNTNNDDVKNS